LIQMAKFAMIYNSTIGLEAAIMGAPVLCAGRSRFTQIPTVFFPSTVEAYRKQLEEFLIAGSVTALPEFQKNARRFLYYQLFISSLPFDEFIQPDGIWPGFVRFKKLNWQKLTPQDSLAMGVLVDSMTRLVNKASIENSSPLLPPDENGSDQNNSLFMLLEQRRLGL